MERKNDNQPDGKNRKSQVNQAKVSGVDKEASKKLQGNETRGKRKRL